MSAVMNRKVESAESERVTSSNENEKLTEQVIQLRSDVRHIQSDVANIYAEARATNQRLDWLVTRVDERLERSELNSDKKFDKFEQGVNERFDKVDKRFDKLEASIDERFESAEKSVGERFDKVDKRFDKLEASIDERFESVGERFDKVNDRFERIEARLDKVVEALSSAKIWALGLYIAGMGAMLFVMARGFKWL
jgi:DNA anti-recombination protein RmuC